MTYIKDVLNSIAGYICRNALNLAIFIVTVIFAIKNTDWNNPEYTPLLMILSATTLTVSIMFSEFECYVKCRLRSSGYKRDRSESNRNKEIWVSVGEPAYILNNKVLRGIKLTTSLVMVLILIVSYSIL